MVPKKTLLKLTGGASAAMFGGLFAFSQFTGKAAPEERAFKYPGDDLVDAEYDNAYLSTYAVTIDAPAYAVWRHPEQTGRNKVDSYSPEFLERAFVRLPFFNQYEIQGEYQQLDSLVVGDAGPFDFHGMTMEWADVVPGKYLVHWMDTKRPPTAPGSYAFRSPGAKHFAVAWCFYMVPLKSGQTRLINHWRLGYEPDTTFQKVLNWVSIEMIGDCMTNLQNPYVKRALEFHKKQHLTGRFMRSALGGRLFNTGTPAGRQDGTPFFEETYTQRIRHRRQCLASAEVRPPATDDPPQPPAGPESPWAADVDADYFVGWSEPEFSWEEQMRQKREKTYLSG